MRFKAVLLDIDDTLFNFRQSSFEAMQGALARRGVRFTWDDMAEYETYNNALWKQLERGEITRAFLFPERFRRYFAARGLDIDPEKFNTDYLKGLAQGYAFMPHCRELLEALHGNTRSSSSQTATPSRRDRALSAPVLRICLTACSSLRSLAAASRKRDSMTRSLRSSDRNTAHAHSWSATA